MSTAARSNAKQTDKNRFSTEIPIWAGLLLIAIFGFNSQIFAQAEAAIMAIDEKPTSAAGKAGGSIAQGQGRSSSGSSQTTLSASRKTGGQSTPKPSTKSSPKPQSSTNSQSSGKYNGLLVGDKYSFLNFEIASKVQPIYTIKAKSAGASGIVQVEVLIDENGNVLTAHARTGNALLHPEAEKAALATRFNKPSVYGKPARAIGFVVYRFGKSEDDD